jgi:hypothetical protein
MGPAYEVIHRPESRRWANTVPSVRSVRPRPVSLARFQYARLGALARASGWMYQVGNTASSYLIRSKPSGKSTVV